MGVGGLVGAVVANGWRRRRGVPTGPDEPGGDLGGDLGGDPGSEPTVEVLR
jgi:hypothetical protein